MMERTLETTYKKENADGIYDVIYRFGKPFLIIFMLV